MDLDFASAVLFTARFTVTTRYSANVAAHDHFGRTPLHLACQYGRLGISSELLRHGASLTDVDYNGEWTLCCFVTHAFHPA